MKYVGRAYAHFAKELAYKKPKGGGTGLFVMHAQGLNEMRGGFFKSAVLKKDCSISTKQVEDVDVRITTSILFACGMWSLVIG